MPNDVDKSLLDRLQALRGATPERTTPTKINVDLIERKKTPTREDTLTARLKSLRSRSEGSPSSKSSSPQVSKYVAAGLPSASPLASKPSPSPRTAPPPADEEEFDALFQTDDRTLEELLGDVGPEDTFATEPDDAKVKAFLEELSRSVPQDDVAEKTETGGDKKGRDSDDSDGEEMSREVDNVIAKFKDELELEAWQSKDDPIPSIENEEEEEEDSTKDTAPPDSDLTMPSLPFNLDILPSSNAPRASADIDDITARLAALRAPSKPAATTSSDDLSLPSVPTSKPSGKPINRLTSRTNYTDDDVDSWCTVCLEDATLRCLGCDDDVYCTRCWREMHIGPAAGFDERSHKAVQFTKDKKKKNKKVMIGA